MKITPLDLKKTDFRTALRGYDREEVQAMLTAAAETLEETVRENLLLKNKNETLEERTRGYQEKESTLNETLVMAQKASDQARQNAQREAELIKAKAEVEAEKMLDRARARLMELKLEIEELEHQKNTYMMRLRSLVASQWKLLQDEKEEDEKIRGLDDSRKTPLQEDNSAGELPSVVETNVESQIEEEVVEEEASAVEHIGSFVEEPLDEPEAEAETEDASSSELEEEPEQAEESEDSPVVSEGIREMLKETNQVAETFLSETQGDEVKDESLDLNAEGDTGDPEDPNLLWGDEEAEAEDKTQGQGRRSSGRGKKKK